MKRLPEKLVGDIQFELAEIEQEINDIKPLLDLLSRKEPDMLEIRAVASTLHSFYKGVESIFTLIAKNVDNASFIAEQWHIQLLNSMKDENLNRTFVISHELFNELKLYLAFRHRFRNLYTFRLDWSLMAFEALAAAAEPQRDPASCIFPGAHL